MTVNQDIGVTLHERDAVRVSWRRVFFSLVWAIPLAVAMDAAVGWMGDHFSRSLYRFDTAVPVVLADESRKIDLLIVGGCRAAINIDPAILSGKLDGTKVFNAGKVSEGMGTVEFASYVGLSHHAPKIMLLVIDDNNLQEFLDDGRSDASAKVPLLPLMTPAYRKAYISVYHPPLMTQLSGLWRYRGQGREIAAAAAKALLHRPVPAVDGYTPRPATQNIAVTIKSDEAALSRNMLRTETLSSYSHGVVSRIIAAAKAGGTRPVLVVVPMHFYRATDAVNDKQFSIISQLARENGVSAMFYPENRSSFAHTNAYWSDSGHMNQLGAEHFSAILGRDLQTLLQENDGGNVVMRLGSHI